jgi:hypothetical protein
MRSNNTRNVISELGACKLIWACLPLCVLLPDMLKARNRPIDFQFDFNHTESTHAALFS